MRYFLDTRNINILDESYFKKSNICFTNVLKESRKSGKGDTNHYPEIEPEDLRKLYQSFDPNCPNGLQEKVWFDIMFHLVRRGRENLRGMTKETFAVSSYATGEKSFFKTKVKLTKITTFRTMHLILQVKIEFTKLEVFSVQYVHLENTCCWCTLYTGHYGNEPEMLLHPKNRHGICAAPLGEKSLGNMMAKLSTKYGLSERYTNHSIRVTSLQILEDENIEGRHIIRISGHKSVDSIQNYARRLSGTWKRNISSLFSNHLANTSSTQHVPPCSKNYRASSISTVGTTVGNSINKENLVDFHAGIDDQTLSKFRLNYLMIHMESSILFSLIVIIAIFLST